MIRPLQLFERVINKGAKGIAELEASLGKLSIEMLKEDQPEQSI